MSLLETSVALLGATASAGVFKVWLDHRIEKRRALNNLLAVASEDFFRAANKIMTTPGDIPDSVLSLLSFMSGSAFQRKSERRFLTALRASREPKALHDKDPVFSDIANLRPELRDLVGEATAAWFNIMTHKSSRYHDLIALEVTATKYAQPKDRRTDAAVGLPVAHAMEEAGCAA